MAISVPTDLFYAAEDIARRSHLSRSALYAQTLAAYVRRRRGRGVTEKLNEVYSAVDSGMGPVLYAMHFASLPRSGESWD
jgi:predicted transcriptional regulator